ncbi:MAG: GGDEF domain-containing protein [Vallitaleaceae bacterium]|nr:GGDEF domain-containing protein [Vallitaleaceae bacterium]
MDKTILTIIQDEDISTLYQPIVNLVNAEIMGYEALSRGPEWSSLFSPIHLIQEAELHGYSYELEFLMRKKAFENLSGMDLRQKLFVNVNPNFIRSDKVEQGRTLQLIEGSGIRPENIVFELTEHTMITDYDAFNEILNHYRKQKYKIAIDDVGAGYSGLRTIRETIPEYVKIDMELIRHIDKDTVKESLIDAILSFATKTGIKVIAEGIETEAELKKLMEIGVHYGQGYFLQRPQRDIVPLRKELVSLITETNKRSREIFIFDDTKNMIGQIVDPDCFVDESVSCERVKKLFEEKGSEGICVVKNGKPIGIVMRENLLFMLSSQYGLSLYAHKKISHVMDNDFLKVEHRVSVSDASRLAMNRDRGKAYDILVVIREGEYFGIVSIHSLLKTLIRVESQYAKELNPLTNLPGNSIINRVLNDLIVYKEEACVVYLDVDHFKPYNDIYGFEAGDQMIVALAELILEEVRKVIPFGSFIGHIGGDDFIFVAEAAYVDIQKICCNIAKGFEVLVKKSYTKEDLDRGYIISKDRDQQIKKFDLLTISMSGIYGRINQYENVMQLSHYMSGLKKQAKSQSGNSIVIENNREIKSII